MRIERLDGQSALLALADAVAVERGGDLASAFAVELAIDAMRAMGERKWRKRKAWERMMRDIDARVADQPQAGEASLVAVAMRGAHVYGACVGRCAAWALARGVEQDLAGLQDRSPLIGSGEAAGRFFETTIAGPDEDGRGGGALLLMTSGVWGHVDRKHLIDAALRQSAENAVARIEEVARWRFNGALAEDVGAVVVRR